MLTIENLPNNHAVGANEVGQTANNDQTSSNESFISILNELNEVESHSDDLQIIPAWVDPSYGYDPLNPRKPNLKEMMNIIDVQINSDAEETKYLSSSSNIIAAQILYGAVGSNEDTRDWQKIMGSENIIEAAHQETAKLHEPKLEIISEFDGDMVLVDQKAAIKNKEEETLSILGGSAAQIKEKLFTYGVTVESIPENINEQITIETFEQEVITGIQDFKSEMLDAEGVHEVNVDPEVIINNDSQPLLVSEEPNAYNQSLLTYLTTENSILKTTDLFLDSDEDNA